MRIGMMVDVYKSHVSGITSYIALNKRCLEAMGHEVFVFTFGVNYTDDEPNVYRSQGLPLLKTGYYLSLAHSRPVVDLLGSMDLVHVHHPFVSGSLALRYCRSRGIPILFTNHTRYDLYMRSYAPFVPRFLGNALLGAYLRSFCSACDLVVSPSEGMRQVLKSFGVEKNVQVVPNGADLGPFQGKTRPIPREHLGFSAEDRIFVFTGRLGPEKNLAFLLRAFMQAYQADKRLGLLLVGDGPQREELKKMAAHLWIAERVCFTGMVAYHQIPAYLAAADIFVTASVTEVHPYTVIEALAAGLPVLGIHSPGVSDTIRDGETGCLLLKPDEESFADRMVAMAGDPEELIRMGALARLAAQEYSIENTSRLMLSHYNRLVEQARMRSQKHGGNGGGRK